MRLLALRHVEMENLGIFEEVYENLGLSYKYPATFKGERIEKYPFLEDFPGKVKASQWDGNIFDLSKGAVRWFFSEKYENQGIVYEKSVGLKNHLEGDKELALTWGEFYQKVIFQLEIDSKSLGLISASEVKQLKELSLKLSKNSSFYDFSRLLQIGCPEDINIKDIDFLRN